MKQAVRTMAKQWTWSDTVVASLIAIAGAWLLLKPSSPSPEEIAFTELFNSGSAYTQQDHEKRTDVQCEQASSNSFEVVDVETNRARDDLTIVGLERTSNLASEFQGLDPDGYSDEQGHCYVSDPAGNVFQAFAIGTSMRTFPSVAEPGVDA